MLYLRRQEKKTPYLFLLPAVVMILIVFLYPIVTVLVKSFFSISGTRETFVGTRNFEILLKDKLFWTAFVNNLRFFICVPVLIIFGIIAAVVLYSQIHGWKLYRTLMLFPYIFSITVTGIVFDCILRENGLLNEILSRLGLGSLAQPWLGQTSTAVYAVMAVIIWKEFGYGVMLILARLMSVDESMIEAAKLDGANMITITRRILLSEIKPVVTFYFVLCMINMLAWLFNYVYVMTKGGPINSTYVMDFYIYQLAVKFSNYGMAYALAVILLCVTFLLVAAQALIRKFLFREEEAL